MIGERLTAYRGRLTANLSELKAFLLESGDSPRSVVKSEALYRFALEELTAVLEYLEDSQSLLAEHAALFTEASEEITHKIDDHLKDATEKAECLLISIKEEQSALSKQREQMLQFYKTLYQCIQGLGNQTQDQIKASTADAKHDINIVLQESIDSTQKLMATQHDVLTKTFLNLIRNEVQQLSIGHGQSMEDQSLSLSNTLMKKVLLTCLLSSIAGGVLSTVFFHFLL